MQINYNCVAAEIHELSIQFRSFFANKNNGGNNNIANVWLYSGGGLCVEENNGHQIPQ